MSTTGDSLRDLQLAIETFLSAQDYVSDAGAATPIPMRVVSEYRLQHEAAIDEAVAKDMGVCLFIHSPAGEVKHANQEGPTYEPALLVVSCFENPDVNQAEGGTGETVVAIAGAVARLLHQQTLTEANGPLHCVSRTMIADPDYARMDVVFHVLVAEQPANTHPPIRANRVTP